MKTRLTKEIRRTIVIVSMLAGVCWGAADAQAMQISVTPSAPAVGVQVTFTATGCAGCFNYIWQIGDVGGGFGPMTTHTFQEGGTYTIQVQATEEVCDWMFGFCWEEPRSRTKQIEVAANEFTVNVIPSAGCTVLARDGGVDVDADNNPDGNGIVCSGGMAANAPLCTEQFAKSSVASLKVVSEPGYELAYWEMNGGILQQADAGPLFLSTMPMLAGIVPIPSITNTATMKAHCLSLSLESVTFEGMSAQILRDNGEPYPGPYSTPPQPHWKKTDNTSYKPSPVVFTSGSTMAATATFTVQPADFSGELFIMGRWVAPDDNPNDNVPPKIYLFPSKKASIENGVASVTIPCATKFPDTTVDIFDPMSITWFYQAAGGRFQDAGTSENQVYVTWAPPACKTEMPPCIQAEMYHTVVHLGSKNAKGQTTEAGTVSAIWGEFKDNQVMNVAGTQLRYYNPENLTTAQSTPELLQDENHTGECSAWAALFIDSLRAQGISSAKRVRVVESFQPGFAEFLIKKWDFSGNGNSPSTAPYVYILGDDVKDSDGIAGQGNLNPPAKFIRHFIVSYNGRYYDPSYGGNSFSSPKEWENASIAGFALKVNSITVVKPNDPNTLETEFIEE